MQLLAHLRAEKISFRDFAEKLGETENIVRKWAYRQRQPSLPNALKVEVATGGAVTPRDLLLSSAEAE